MLPNLSEDAKAKAKKHGITVLLTRWGCGDRHALDKLEPLVHETLFRSARRLLGKESSQPTLEPAELVNVAWIKIIEAGSPTLANREHFYNLAGRIMKRHLINRAVARKATKMRDMQGQRVVLIYPENLDKICGTGGSLLLELDQALDGLRLLDSRKERIITLYCFCGFKREKIAETENISVTTVKRELRFSFSWLRAELGGLPPHARD